MEVFEAIELDHLSDGAVDLFSGMMGGVSVVYSGQPLDTVKVKMQTFPHLYKNFVYCWKETFRTDGMSGLYAGTVPALVSSVAENAVLFASYGFCQKVVARFENKKDPTTLTPLENAFAGSLTAFFTTFVLTPTELIKCKLQARREMDPNIRCTPFSVTRDAYGARPYLVVLEDSLFDLIKSRMQVSGRGNFCTTLIRAYNQGGIQMLYRGLLPTLLRTFFSSGALFITFEYTKKFLRSFS